MTLKKGTMVGSFFCLVPLSWFSPEIQGKRDVQWQTMNSLVPYSLFGHRRLIDYK